MIKLGIDSEKDAILRIADGMCLAAKTAPKGSGKDSIRACVVTGEDKDELAKKMHEMAELTGTIIYDRDAENVNRSTCVVLIGCRAVPFGLNGCGMCGFDSCVAMRNAGGKCAFNLTDLGIAVGSAVSLAADNRVDNRVMYTVGRTAMKMRLLGDETDVIWGIPLYAGSKDQFFDRGAGAVVDVSK